MGNKPSSVGELLLLDCEDEGPSAAGSALNSSQTLGRREMELHRECLQWVERGKNAVNTVGDYRGCEEAIRACMASPSDQQVQLNAFSVLEPSASETKSFHVLGMNLQTLLPRLIKALSQSQFITDRPSLVGDLVAVLAVALEWDLAKMLRPQIQNDFACYRRILPKVMAPDGTLPEGTSVTDSEAYSISMFVAEATPLLSFATQATLEASEPHPEDVIAQAANVCCRVLKAGSGSRSNGLSESHRHTLLLGMTCCLVLYDRVSEKGVFAKGARVKVGQCIRVLTKHGGSSGQQLRNCLRYSSATYDSHTTPSRVRRALEGE